MHSHPLGNNLGQFLSRLAKTFSSSAFKKFAFFRSAPSRLAPKRFAPVRFAPVRFAYDSSELSPAQTAICEGVAQYLKTKRGVILEGHADERGSRDYNLALGERRALAVRAYLIELGVDPVKIQTRSFGEENPANKNHDEDAWSENRRVEFAIY